MKAWILSICISFVFITCKATQQQQATTTENQLVAELKEAAMQPVLRVNQAQIAEDVHYLASDELGGRGIGSKGIAQAYEYISQIFAENDLAPAPGKVMYSQDFTVVKESEAKQASLSFDGQSFSLQEDLLVLKQVAFDKSAPLHFLNSQSAEEIQKLDLTGKIAISVAGSTTATDPRLFYQLAKEKQKAAQSAGALALIELYRSPKMPFKRLYAMLGRGGVALADKNASIPLLWLNDPTAELQKRLGTLSNTEVQLKLVPGSIDSFEERNIAGFVRGTDAKMSKEYMVITAHYDHLGVQPNGTTDSIYNGARDNALGLAALLGIARDLKKFKPKRSVLLLAVSAEESGLLGSEYYAQNPLIPLKETVFNLNFDGAGYTDTTAVIMNGYGRTNCQTAIDAAIELNGLKANPDPVPQMNLYQYSDNWSFAKRGVPAINIAPGFQSFSADLMKNYHQPGDHSDNLNFKYVSKYVAAAVGVTRALSTSPKTIDWVEGDPLAKEKS